MRIANWQLAIEMLSQRKGLAPAKREQALFISEDHPTNLLLSETVQRASGANIHSSVGDRGSCENLVLQFIHL